MRIGIVSDTHMPRRGQKLPCALVKGLRGVDLILHAGDWTSPSVIPMFESLAPVDSVAGNNDGADIVKRFGRHKIIAAGGLRIGLVHGDGAGGSTKDIAFHTFRNLGVDLIVFGHSHIPYMEEREGILLFNPGSPSDKRLQPKYSYGLLDIGEDQSLRLRHIYYRSKE
ncbi:metallophosphoesterase family protein [Paenibacillus popilliae]|uniref:Phosphoesterase n=1 Tax=Paenibacillus popilliae ATCC 14706 TaxID=1212764 RepID=M9LXN1_PAEPP|nr:metallophosphoesterase family protein [Paenibacillus popilliae]GAC40789.1 predicted phosphoesterase [Paenibacillus popilliae ATCC 14706]